LTTHHCDHFLKFANYLVAFDYTPLRPLSQIR